MEDFDNASDIHIKLMEKRIGMLNVMAKAPDPLDLLNAMLIDEKEGIKEIKSFKESYLYQNAVCKTLKVGDSIRNKSRMTIVCIFDDKDMKEESRKVIDQINLLGSLGHEVILYSKFSKPPWLKCNCYFLVHHDTDFYHVVPKPDILLAGNWSLVPDILKIRAPLKYLYMSDESILMNYNDMNEELRIAIVTALGSPVKILVNSDSSGRLIFDLFGRVSLIIQKDLQLKSAAKKLETEFIRAAQNRIQVVKLYNANF